VPKTTSLVSFVLATIAGVFLLISGIHGPTEIYETIIEFLPLFTQNQQILQIANTLATILITIALAGGLAVIAGGVLILLGRVGTGKFVISIGIGSVLLWLVTLAVALITTQSVDAVISEYSMTGSAGIVLAIAAGTIAK